MTPTVLERLKQVLNAPDREMDLAEIALLIAKRDNPQLSVTEYLGKLTAIAAELRRRLPLHPATGDIIFTMNEFLFDDLRFSGNVSAFYDPDNSFLNRVLDRRLGIPLTLSILYIEVGRSVGLPLQGLTFPGHFLVRYAGSALDVIIDPFNGGLVLHEDDLTAMLERVYRGRTPPRKPAFELLAGVGKMEVAIRMLRNLKWVFMRRQEWDRALWSVDSMLRLDPEQPRELLARGRLYERLQCFPAAARDYRRYLELSPDDGEQEDIRHRLQEVGHNRVMLH